MQGDEPIYFYFENQANLSFGKYLSEVQTNIYLRGGNSIELPIGNKADSDRVRKAKDLLFSQACKGSSTSEF